jgi:hypothetical protein
LILFISFRDISRLWLKGKKIEKNYSSSKSWE